MTCDTCKVRKAIHLIKVGKKIVRVLCDECAGIEEETG